MTRGYQKERTSVHLLNYHFVWCPKYRRKVLTGKIKDKLNELINQKANELGCRVIELKIMPDHVHLFIQSKPTISPNKLIGQIKGYTSRILRNEFPNLLTMPALWTRSYFISTAGKVSSFVIKRYIREQEGI